MVPEVVRWNTNRSLLSRIYPIRREIDRYSIANKAHLYHPQVVQGAPALCTTATVWVPKIYYINVHNCEKYNLLIFLNCSISRFSFHERLKFAVRCGNILVHIYVIIWYQSVPSAIHYHSNHLQCHRYLSSTRLETGIEQMHSQHRCWDLGEYRKCYPAIYLLSLRLRKKSILLCRTLINCEQKDLNQSLVAGTLGQSPHPAYIISSPNFHTTVSCLPIRFSLITPIASSFPASFFHFSLQYFSKLGLNVWTY